MTVRRGTSNSNQRGSAESRRRRKVWLIETYRANVDLVLIDRPLFNDAFWIEWPVTEPLAERFKVMGRKPTCRCYRCGELLTFDTVTVDRIIPGCMGGTYRRNNIRPACAGCNSETGGALAHLPKPKVRAA